jgi:hypothetical protein
MRNVKVNVQADTSHAIGKVRELTGALAQLDATTKRNVQYLLQALSGAGLNPQQIGAVKNQQAATTQAQSQVKAGKVSNTGGNSGGSQGTKTGGQSKDTIDKLNKFTSQTAEAQFNLFAEDLGQMFSKAFSELFQGNIKDALTGLRDSLKGLFNSLLKQLVEDVAGKIRKAITNNLKNLFNKGGTGLNVGAKKPEDAGGKTDNDSGTNVAAPHASPDTPPEAPPHRYSGGHQEGGTDFFDNDYVTDAMDRAGTVAKANDAPKGDPPPKEGGDKGADVGAVTGKFSWGSLGKMVGSMAPALGSSLGGMLGGSSVVGGILGSAGGLIGGTVLSTLLAGGFTGASATGGIFGSIGGAIGLSGVATAGIGIAVAAAFMIGAYILGKNKQRKADEKTRNQAMLDAFSQLDDILKQIQSDQLDGSSGVSQAKNIRSQYMDQVSKLKDKKTRNIALKDVSRIDGKISAIQAAASNQTARKALDAKLVPTFADGGYVGTGGYKVLGGDGASMHPFRGRVPGVYDRRDDFLARLTGNEVVLTPDVWMPIAPYLKQKRVPGFADGGMVQTSGFTGDTQASSNQPFIIEELVINLSNQFGSETAARILDVGVKTPDGRQAVIKSVRSHIGESGLGDGLVRDINRVNTRGF